MKNNKNSLTNNKLICGDNLEVLATIEKESIDLIYIDPPFFSNRNYEIIWGDESEIRSFEDRWEGGINVYIDWIKQRMIELHRILKSTGSFYLHCDWHAGHYLKIMLDEVFGYHNFQNENIWWYETGGLSKVRFARKHDTIFFYTKSKKFTFNPGEIKEKRSDEVLRRIATGNPKATRSTGQYRHPSDVWKIPSINSMAKERLGYPTQKPEALLERIIKTSSNKNDIVCDCFCGCGTSLAVAHKLNRHWIGIDISPSAISLVKNRLSIIGAEENTDFEVIGMPQNIQDLKQFKPFDFQYFVINEMYGVPSPSKVGDFGIDGYSYLTHNPIQVKQSEHIGRNVIDNFETALRRYYKNQKEKMRGYIIAFSFGKGAIEEVARVKREGIEIELVTIQEILNKKFSVNKEINQSLF